MNAMTLQDFSKSIRRRHQRVKVSPFILKNPSLTPVDLSESGIKLFSINKLHVDRQISLELKIQGELLELTGQVMWSRESSSESGFYSGLVFINI
jgi:hypothetical protein